MLAKNVADAYADCDVILIYDIKWKCLQYLQKTPVFNAC